MAVTEVEEEKVGEEMKMNIPIQEAKSLSEDQLLQLFVRKTTDKARFFYRCCLVPDLCEAIFAGEGYEDFVRKNVLDHLKRHFETLSRTREGLSRQFRPVAVSGNTAQSTELAENAANSGESTQTSCLSSEQPLLYWVEKEGDRKKRKYKKRRKKDTKKSSRSLTKDQLLERKRFSECVVTENTILEKPEDPESPFSWNTTYSVEVPSFGEKLFFEIDTNRQEIAEKNYNAKFSVQINENTGFIEELLYPQDVTKPQQKSKSKEKVDFRCKETLDSIMWQMFVTEFYEESTVFGLPSWTLHHDYCRNSIKSGLPFLLEELQKAVSAYNKWKAASLPEHDFTVEEGGSVEKENLDKIIPVSATVQKDYKTLILNALWYPDKDMKSPETQALVAQECQVQLSADNEEWNSKCQSVPFAPLMCRVGGPRFKEIAGVAGCETEQLAKKAEKETEKRLRKLAPATKASLPGYLEQNCGTSEVQMDIGERIKRDMALQALQELKNGFRKKKKISSLQHLNIAELVAAKEHNLTQNTLKPFRCKICDKTFTVLTSLKSHYRSHAGVKPFKCDICEQTFTRRHSLNYHMACHSGEVRFCCPWCNRVFRHAGHFKDHIRIHNSEPFDCPDCGFKFSNRTTLKRHIQLSHHRDTYHPNNSQPEPAENVGEPSNAELASESLDTNPIKESHKSTRSGKKKRSKSPITISVNIGPQSPIRISQSKQDGSLPDVINIGDSQSFLETGDVGQNLVAGDSFESILVGAPSDQTFAVAEEKSEQLSPKYSGKNAGLGKMKLPPLKGEVLMPPKVQKTGNANSEVTKNLKSQKKQGDLFPSNILNADWLSRNKDVQPILTVGQEGEKQIIAFVKPIPEQSVTQAEECRLEGRLFELADCNLILLPPE